VDTEKPSISIEHEGIDDLEKLVGLIHVSIGIQFTDKKEWRAHLGSSPGDVCMYNPDEEKYHYFELFSRGETVWDALYNLASLYSGRVLVTGYIVGPCKHYQLSSKLRY
jgi:hypothetical protein